MSGSKGKEPNFFVVGVVKGGTTSLYNYLDMHPSIFLTPIKESNHFSDADMNHEGFEDQYKIDSGLNIDKYLKGTRELVHIAHVRDRNQYLALYDQADDEIALGEVCNSYFFCKSSAVAIHDSYPESRIIVMLRNPIERVFSQYLMNLREAKVLKRDFKSEIEADYNRTEKGWGVSHNYLELGLYAQQLEIYLNLFPKEQIKLCFFEEFMKNKQEQIDDIFRFLNVGPYPIDNFAQHNSAKMPRSKALNYFLNRSGFIKLAKSLISRERRQKFKGLLYSDKNLPELSVKDKAFLCDFYREDIARLEKMIDKDLSHWLN